MTALLGLRRNEEAFVFSITEATPGPHDSRYLFDQFIALIHSDVAEPAAVSL